MGDEQFFYTYGKRVGVKTCILQRAIGLSEILLRYWVALVVAARCRLCGPIRSKVSSRNRIPNANLI
jgi:hypothetical protein